MKGFDWSEFWTIVAGTMIGLCLAQLFFSGLAALM